MDTSGRSCFQDQSYRKSAVQAASGAYRCFWQKTGRWYRRGIFTLKKEGTGLRATLNDEARQKRIEVHGEIVGRNGLLFEKVLEGLAGVGVTRRPVGRRGTRRVWLRVRGWRGIFFDGHAKFVEGAGVLGVLGRDALLDGLGTLELRAGIEKAALFAAVQLELAFRARAIGIETGSEDRATVGTPRACDRADHARRAGAELVGAARPADGRLAVVRLVLLFLLFRVAVTAVSVLSIHKYLRPPVSTDCHNYNPYSCAVALANLACIQSDCYTRPDRAIIP